MKIAIYPHHGSMYVPKFITEQLSDTTDEASYRIEMAKILEKLKPTHKNMSEEIYNLYAKTKDKSMTYLKDEKNPDIIYVKNFESKFKYIYVIKLVDVDTSKIWKISDYDGAESIEYFKEPVIINKDLNFAQW